MSKKIIQINIDGDLFDFLSYTYTFCDENINKLINVVCKFINPKNNNRVDFEKRILRSVRYAILVLYGYLLYASKSEKLSLKFSREILGINKTLGSFVALFFVFYNRKNILPILFGYLSMMCHSNLLC